MPGIRYKRQAVGYLPMQEDRLEGESSLRPVLWPWPQQSGDEQTTDMVKDMKDMDSAWVLIHLVRWVGARIPLSPSFGRSKEFQSSEGNYFESSGGGGEG